MNFGSTHEGREVIGFWMHGEASFTELRSVFKMLDIDHCQWFIGHKSTNPITRFENHWQKTPNNCNWLHYSFKRMDFSSCLSVIYQWISSLWSTRCRKLWFISFRKILWFQHFHSSHAQCRSWLLNADKLIRIRFHEQSWKMDIIIPGTQIDYGERTELLLPMGKEK